MVGMQKFESNNFTFFNVDCGAIRKNVLENRNREKRIKAISLLSLIDFI